MFNTLKTEMAEEVQEVQTDALMAEEAELETFHENVEGLDAIEKSEVRRRNTEETEFI